MPVGIYMMDNLREVDFLITNDCNLVCDFCYIHGAAYGQHHLLQFQDVLAIWSEDKLPKPEIHLSGGEPMLHAKLIDFIKSACFANFSVQLQTNGFLITDEICREIADLNRQQSRGNISIMLSANTVKNSSNAVLQSIDNLRDKIRTILHYGIYLRINTAVTRTSAADVLSLLDLTSSCSVDMHSFSRFTPIGNGQAIKNEYMSDEEWLDFTHSLARFTRNKLNHLKIKIIVQRGMVPKGSNHSLSISGCPAHKGEIMTILQDNRVVLCPLLAHHQNIEIGFPFSFPSVQEAMAHFKNGHSGGSRICSCAVREQIIPSILGTSSFRHSGQDLEDCCVLQKFEINNGLSSTAV